MTELRAEGHEGLGPVTRGSDQPRPGSQCEYTTAVIHFTFWMHSTLS